MKTPDERMAHARAAMRKLRKEQPDFAARQRELTRQWKEEHPEYPSPEKRREYGRRYYEKHKEKRRAAVREYHRTHLAARREYAHRYALTHRDERKVLMWEANLRRQHVTIDEYHAMLEQQGEQCAICRAVLQPMHKETHIDHDHVTKKVRGLLCGACNLGLGKFKDNPVALRAAAAYLEAHHA